MSTREQFKNYLTSLTQSQEGVKLVKFYMGDGLVRTVGFNQDVPKKLFDLLDDKTVTFIGIRGFGTIEPFLFVSIQGENIVEVDYRNHCGGYVNRQYERRQRKLGQSKLVKFLWDVYGILPKRRLDRMTPDELETYIFPIMESVKDVTECQQTS